MFVILCGTTISCSAMFQTRDQRSYSSVKQPKAQPTHVRRAKGGGAYAKDGAYAGEYVTVLICDLHPHNMLVAL